MSYAKQKYLLTNCSLRYQHSYWLVCQYITTAYLRKYFICSTICFTLDLKYQISIKKKAEHPALDTRLIMNTQIYY